MPVYIDTEFNGFKGQLISMALVTPKGSQWYECLELPDNIDPWVKANVVPFLNKCPISLKEFKKSLHSFLKIHVGIPIVADWPEDLMHLMAMTFEEKGEQLNLEYTCKLVISDKLHSKIPHNALSDAIALMEWHQANRWKDEK